MGFDMIHGCQAAFRSLLDASSYPGRIVDLSRESGLLDVSAPIPRAALLIALSLMDIEVGYYVDAARRAEAETFVSRLCGARPVPLEEADFIFVLGVERDLARVIRGARGGDLVDPHKGATIVAEAEGLSEPGPLVLSGPGIREERRVSVSRDPGWMAARAEKNREFPMGVDLLFFDSRSRVLALPRTTLVAEAS
ncbi:MAG: phosphonate C-P lyase system protein PhnH [Treponema sp.]|nr:phosphonate C-P lyase system protein PhnH [Treponema sp.]